MESETSLPPIPVALFRCNSYKALFTDQVFKTLFEAAGPDSLKNVHVLVKPNLVTPRDPLAASEPDFIGAVCSFLVEMGARVRVGDSPAFGSARRVAIKSGLLDALKGLDVEFSELDKPKKIKLPSGISVGISQKALDADLIINCPRFKAHAQAGITAGVKNFFGCVTGFRKAFAHCKYGDVGTLFETILTEIPAVLPPSFSIVDAITAMDTTGPSGGCPCNLGIIAASASPFAVDTVFYNMLNIPSDLLPVHREALRRELRGTNLNDISFPLERPQDFNLEKFRLPERLQPFTFHPVRLVKGRLKSLYMRFF